MPPKKSKKQKSQDISNAENEQINQQTSTKKSSKQSNEQSTEQSEAQTKLIEQINNDFNTTDELIENRIRVLQETCESECRILSLALGRALANIPPAAQSMTLRDFVVNYGHNLDVVQTERSIREEQSLASFEAKTPRLNRERKALQTNGRSQVLAYASILNTPHTVTRARKRAMEQTQPGELHITHNAHSVFATPKVK